MDGMAAVEWRRNWLWSFSTPAGPLLSYVLWFFFRKNASGVSYSLPSLGTGYQEGGKVLLGFLRVFICQNCFSFTVHFSLNCLLQFFYSFIINGSRVLSNVCGTEPGAMWYFRFGWVDMKEIHVLTLCLGSRPKALLHVLTFPKIACTFRSAVQS